MELTVKAAAKINLFLDVVGKLDNGYHLLNTIYQSIGLYDTLNIFYDDDSKDSQTLTISIESMSKLIPLDKSNLTYQATELFFNKIQRYGSIKILIDKQIPVGAGLGGGSADAAATLLALNNLFNNVLSPKDLCHIAKNIGADVPFCLLGGTSYGTNIGDQLEPLTNLDLDLIVIKPKDILINTNWAYTRYDNLVTKPQHISINNILTAIKQSHKKNVIKNLYNSLEYGVISAYPVLGLYKSKLLSLGCYKVMMSGSGSALFTIVDDELTAEKVLKHLDKNNIDSFFVKAVEKSNLIL